MYIVKMIKPISVDPPIDRLCPLFFFLILILFHLWNLSIYISACLLLLILNIGCRRGFFPGRVLFLPAPIKVRHLLLLLLLCTLHLIYMCGHTPRVQPLTTFKLLP